MVSPATWIRWSFWSDQMNGTELYGALSSGVKRFLAAKAACSVAVVQCSVRRIWPPSHLFGARATSPTAYTPRMPALSVSSQTTPSSTDSPEPASHSVFGTAPIPTTNSSAGSTVPSVRATASMLELPWTSLTPTPNRRSMSLE